SDPATEIVSVANSTSGLCPIARTFAPLAISTDEPATTQSDEPPVCGRISVQLPAVVLSVLIVTVASITGESCCAKHMLPTSCAPKQMLASLDPEPLPASISDDCVEQKLPPAIAMQLWPLGQLSRARSHGAPATSDGV